MTKELFWKQVEKHLRRATDKERYAIRAELEGHIEDHALALEEAGYPAGEAVERAVAAMGEPEEIGRALNAQFSIFWKVMIWVGSLLIVVLLWEVLTSAYTMNWTVYKKNRQARTDPYNTYCAEQAGEKYTLSQGLEIRETIGNDELYVYWVGIDPKANEAMVAMCMYDQDPFGWVSRNALFSMWLENQAGETGLGGGGGSDAAVANRRIIVPVEPGDTHVVLRYDRFGEELTIEVPLPREVTP